MADRILAGLAIGSALGRRHVRLPAPEGATARAACSYRTELADLMEAAQVTASRRCRRQGCAQLWPTDDAPKEAEHG